MFDEYFIYVCVFVDSSENGDMFSNCSGARLCKSLVKVYDAVSLRPFEQYPIIKLAAINALKGLLAISAAAKLTAVEGMPSEIFSFINAP